MWTQLIGEAASNEGTFREGEMWHNSIHAFTCGAHDELTLNPTHNMYCSTFYQSESTFVKQKSSFIENLKVH